MVWAHEWRVPCPLQTDDTVLASGLAVNAVPASGNLPAL